MFTFDDLRIQLNNITRLESLGRAKNRVAGMGAMAELLKQPGALREIDRLVGMIDAMTPDERRNPVKAGEPNRCRRIAAGSGVTPNDVSQFVKHMLGLAEMMKLTRG